MQEAKEQYRVNEGDEAEWLYKRDTRFWKIPDESRRLPVLVATEPWTSQNFPLELNHHQAARECCLLPISRLRQRVTWFSLFARVLALTIRERLRDCIAHEISMDFHHFHFLSPSSSCVHAFIPSLTNTRRVILQVVNRGMIYLMKWVNNNSSLNWKWIDVVIGLTNKLMITNNYDGAIARIICTEQINVVIAMDLSARNDCLTFSSKDK